MDKVYEVVDFTNLFELAGDDRDVVVELVDIFLKQTPQILNNIDEAMHLSDWSTVSLYVHKLKPSLGTLGMEKERELAILIEEDCKALNLEIIQNRVNVLKKKCLKAIDELQHFREH